MLQLFGQFWVVEMVNRTLNGWASSIITEGSPEAITIEFSMNTNDSNYCPYVLK